MAKVLNGMPADGIAGVTWRKSSRSGAVGNCVEIAQLPDGDVAMRNSRFPGGPALVYRRQEVTAFLHAAKDGEFDDLV